MYMCFPPLTLILKHYIVVNVHSVQVVVAVVCNDDLVCMVCKCTAVCHVLLGYIVLELTIASLFFTILPVL